MSDEVRASTRRFVRTLLRTLPRRTLLVLALMMVGTLTEGVGILILVPLLSVLGIDAGGEALGRVEQVVRGALDTLGLTPTLGLLLGVFVAIIAGRAALRGRETIEASAVEQDFVRHLRARLHRAVLRSEWVAFARRRTADVMHVQLDELHRVSVAGTHLARLATQLLTILVYLALALALSPALTLVAGLAGGGLLLVLRRWTRLAHVAGAELGDAGNAMYVALDAHLGSMHLAKAYGAEEANVTAFGELLQRVARAQVAIDRHHAVFTALFTVGTALVLAAIVYIAIAWLDTSFATLLLLLLLFARIVPRFAAVQSSHHQFVNVVPAFSRAMVLIESCEREAEPVGAATDEPTLARGIELEDVSFGYAGADGEVVTGLDLWIPAGEATAIVGASGAGKSTIADLVMGLLPPTRGRVVVDGRPLEAEARRAWRGRVGYVPQDSFLFHATVRENLLWARADADEPALWAALEMAAAASFVARLPRGLDTVVGDRGVLLSGGERQRLALARALVRAPTLLVLDEATSALDADSESEILRAIARLRGRTTVLVISHRLTTIRCADHIHVLEGGRLTESGTWEDLVRREDGRLRALHRAHGPREPLAGRPTESTVPYHD